MGIALLIVGLIILTIFVVRYPPLSLIFLFSAGFLKAFLSLQFSFFRAFDLTVLSEVFLLIVMAYSYVKNNRRFTDMISLPLILYLLLGAMLLLGVFITSAPKYGFQKSTRFMTFGLTIFLAPIVFSNSFKDIKLMLFVLVGLAAMFSIGTIIAPDIVIGMEETTGRATFLGTNPLAVAGESGVGIVISFCFVVMTYRSVVSRAIFLTLIMVMWVALLISGSRGPFLGVIVTGILALFLLRKGTSSLWMLFIMIIAVVGMAIILIRSPEEGATRIKEMWKGTYEAQKATESRTEMFVWALEGGIKRPLFGHGTGAFAVDRGGEDVMSYPHNMILETFYEQGLVGAVIATSFLLSIFNRWRKAARLARHLGVDIGVFETVHIAGLIFFFLFTQAMKSGDLNSNRQVFFAAGLIIAALNCLNSMANDISTLAESPVPEESCYQCA